MVLASIILTGHLNQGDANRTIICFVIAVIIGVSGLVWHKLRIPLFAYLHAAICAFFMVLTIYGVFRTFFTDSSRDVVPASSDTQTTEQQDPK